MLISVFSKTVWPVDLGSNHVSSLVHFDKSQAHVAFFTCRRGSRGQFDNKVSQLINENHKVYEFKFEEINYQSMLLWNVKLHYLWMAPSVTFYNERKEVVTFGYVTFDLVLAVHKSASGITFVLLNQSWC